MSGGGPKQRPRWHDAYDAQMGLWRFYRQPRGQYWLMREFERSAKGLSGETRNMLADLWGGEPQRLLAADPFYVTGNMCEVVEAARHSFQPEPILPTDFLSPVGFCFYETPFVMESKSVITSIGAFSWQPIIATFREGEELPDAIRELPEGMVDIEGGASPFLDAWQAGHGGVALTLYASTEAEEAEDHEGYALLKQMFGHRLWAMHATPWWFGMEFSGNEVDELGIPTGAVAWWQLLQTTLRLMQQRIAHHTNERLDRHTRRDAVRHGYREREVVVVRLRREGHDYVATEPEHDVPWSHRWIVGGHWRNQPYPSEGIYRQIWISPYVKGPEDKPLVIRPRRVYQWER